MKEETVKKDNTMFFVSTVGMSLGMEYFAQAVLESSMELSQFLTDHIGKPGYIRIDSSAIREKGEDSWHDFVNKVMGGLLARVSYGLSSATKFNGDFSERVMLKKDGYIFFYHIKQYERDSAHGFEIIDPEDLGDVPEHERLGRVVYLTIILDEK